MRFLLDTDCCVYLFTNEHPALTERVRECAPQTLCVSTVTFAELALGSAHGKIPSSKILDSFALDVAVLDFDIAASRAYARLPFRRGRFDRLIGAHALSLDLAVITNNEPDFADIPGLRIENWTL
jgi:tRNA(fMet)-specific endonuclease VapC